MRQAARAQGIGCEAIREGRHGEIWLVGKTTVEVPRHREIGPKGAFVVRNALEAEFGKGWWR
jgi:hypothetical protein